MWICFISLAINPNSLIISMISDLLSVINHPRLFYNPLSHFSISTHCLLSFYSQSAHQVFSHHSPDLSHPQVCFHWTWLSAFPVSPFTFSSIQYIFLGQHPCWITFFFICFSPLPSLVFSCSPLENGRIPFCIIISVSAFWLNFFTS